MKTKVIRAEHMEITEDEITVHLEDGRRLTVPVAWYPKLMHATDAERNNWRVLGKGIGFEWPDLDEHLSVAGFLAGTPAPS